MGKNIAVIDAQGNVYASTWPKRARGLVKSGRARFIDQNKICLMRPPGYSEGKCMDHTVEQKMIKEPKTDAPKEGQTAGAEAAGSQESPDMSYVLCKIDEILAGNDELKAAIAQMENLDDTPAEALSHMMEAREMTNQKLIVLLQNVLETVKPDPALIRLETVTNLLSNAGLEENHKFDLLNQTIQRLF